MSKAAIFDLDGTLLNTLEDLAAACNHALAQEGFAPHPTEAYRYFVGNGVKKLIARIVPPEIAQTEALLLKLTAHFDAYYALHGQDLTKPYDGILPMLDKLAAEGYRLAVLSNKPHAFVQTLTAHYFGDRFAAVYGNRPGYPVKPEPSLLKEVLAKIDAAPGDALYLGDSGVDMQTAKNGDVLAIGVLWGFRDKEELLENGADILLESPEQLFRYIPR